MIKISFFLQRAIWVALVCLPFLISAQSFLLTREQRVYIVHKDSLLRIEWGERSNNNLDSLYIKATNSAAKIKFYLTRSINGLVSKDSTFCINGNSYCDISLVGVLKDSLVLDFFIESMGLKAKFIFLSQPLVLSNPLIDDTLIVNHWTGRADKPLKDKYITIMNPTSDSLSIEGVPDWLQISQVFIPPNKKVKISFSTLNSILIDSLNFKSNFPLNNICLVETRSLKITKINIPLLKSIKILIKRDISESLFWAIVLLFLGGLIGSLIAGQLIKKKNRSKVFNQIKSYMENQQGHADEEIRDISQFIASRIDSKSSERIKEILFAYLKQIEYLHSVNKIDKVQKVSFIEKGAGSQEVADIVNKIIDIVNYRISQHESLWKNLGEKLKYEDNNPNEYKDYIDLLLNETEEIKNGYNTIKDGLFEIISLEPTTTTDEAFKKIKYNLDSLNTLTNDLNAFFKITGQNSEEVRRNLERWHQDDTNNWNTLSRLLSINNASRADIIQKLEDIFRNINSINKKYNVGNLNSLEKHFDDSKEQAKQYNKSMAKILSIDDKDISNENIKKGLETFINNTKDFKNRIIIALNRKIKENSGEILSISQGDENIIIQLIESLKDPKFGKPHGFPEFVDSFKQKLKTAEYTLRNLIENMRFTEDAFFTNMLKTAYNQPGRQKGIKPTLDTLNDDSKLRVQLKIGNEDMKYLKEKIFYDNFIKDFLDGYANDLAKVYAYSKVQYETLRVSDILLKEHSINASDIQVAYQSLYDAYEIIGISLHVPVLFEDYFDPIKHDGTPQGRSGFKDIQNSKYASLFETMKKSIIYDLHKIGIKSESLDIDEKPIVFRR